MRDGDKKENEKTMKPHFKLIQGKEEEMLESIHIYSSITEVEMSKQLYICIESNL